MCALVANCVVQESVVAVTLVCVRREHHTLQLSPPSTHRLPRFVICRMLKGGPTVDGVSAAWSSSSSWIRRGTILDFPATLPLRDLPRYH